MRRQRNAKIIATLGPASTSPAVIAELFAAGADVFRLNFSHGSHADHRARVATIRDLEARVGRPVGILLDLQGPKLRLGVLQGGSTRLHPGSMLRLDLDPEPGGEQRVCLPHPEVFAALEVGTDLLIDDGRVRLQVERRGDDWAEARVVVGGSIADHKGVNVPGVVLPLSPLSAKDREDVALGLELGVDWIALSFVQRASDVEELRALVGGRAALLSKLEKPAAIEQLEAIVSISDAVMVARGDLGVELPPEQVPTVQKRIIRSCRMAGKPVVVATQMLESMVHSPTPTRAEASDVAHAIYDGADAVMLSGETAVGEYPVQAVAMMDRIIVRVEQDPHYKELLSGEHLAPDPTTADAICFALRNVASVLRVAATVTYTSSGFTSLRAARERPEAPILCLTPHRATARRMALVWGVHPVHGQEVTYVDEMIATACRIAVEEGFASSGQPLAIAAGLPFGQSGTTNLLHVAWIHA